MRGLVLLAVLVAVANATRGVPPSREHLYEGSEFACTDGSASFPSSRVNDDFCDCEDGSDEPGTSACANGHFFCPNPGFRGKTVSTMIVNDGVCDCCDGSDEWQSGKCGNRCEEEGRDWRQHMAERIKQVESGAAARKEYAAKGTEAVAAASSKASASQALVAELEEKLAAAKAKKAEIEANAASVAAATSASQDDQVALALGIHDMTAEQLRRAFVRLARAADATDKAVELAKELAKESAEAVGGDAAAAEGAVSWPTEAEPAAASTAATAEVDEEIRSLEADKRVADTDKASAEKDSTTDFGPDSAFYPLKDKCVELKIAQYVYKVCPFENARQDHTSLGLFSGWKDGSDYSIMEFTGGQQCWNGPSRSLTLTLECGSEDKLVHIDEPSKCAYAARMTTPAACDREAANKLRLELGEPASVKDEL